MRIEKIQFPSDPQGITGGLREELVKACRKADTYPTKQKLIRSQLVYALSRLDESVKDHAATAKKIAASLKAELLLKEKEQKLAEEAAAELAKETKAAELKAARKLVAEAAKGEK